MQIEVQHCSFAYPGQESLALRDLSFSISAGTFVVLCGPSGSGKSTLLRQCKPILAPHGTASGTILFEGRPLSELDQREQSTKIGFVGQSPDGQLVTDKVWHELAFGLESLGCDTPTIRRRVAEMASFFGIQTWFHREVSTLSGGQKQLLNLAAVMTLNPSVLLLDEPTSQLDPIAASEFLELLARINRDLGVTILLSEHHLEEAFALADQVLVLDGGTLVCSGPPAQTGERLRALHHPMTAALPAPMGIWAAVQGEGTCPITVRQGRQWLRQYTETHPLNPVPERTVPTLGETLLTGKEIWFRHQEDQPDLLQGLSLSVRRGEILAVLGGNGTGKSTTLGLLAGRYTPRRGTIDRQGRISLLPQDPQTVFVHKTVREDLTAQLKENKALSKTEREQRLQDMARLCGLTALLDRHPYDLSGGEQQRAALALVLLTRPDVLLLDEPTKGLDAAFQENLAQILHRLAARGTAILMVSHDVTFCAKHAHRCALLFDGSIAAEDPPQAFFSGNSFYTTAANRMARSELPQAVTAEEVIAACGGTVPPPPLWPPEGPEKDLPKRPADHSTSPERHQTPLSRKAWMASLISLGLILLTLFLGTHVLEDRKYYFISLLIVLEVLLPFFVLFEKRKPRERELVLLASLCALGVAGRAAFFMLPQCKPVTALTILTGASLGGPSGFLVGAVTMLVSNLFFGQGPWTPWQMAAMGLIGWAAGWVFRRPESRTAWRLSLFGILAVLLLYGGIMNPASALMWAHTLNWELLLSYYLTGLPMDLVHGVTTAALLFFIGVPILEKLDRIQTKYGMLM